MEETQPREENNGRNCFEASKFLSELGWISVKRVCLEGVQGEEWRWGGLEDSERKLSTHHFETVFAHI